MVTSEWPHNIDSEKIDFDGRTFNIEAGEQERKDVARRLKVESIDALSAHFDVKREDGNVRIRVSGTVKADITQNCIVSGDPITQHIEEDIAAFYTDQNNTVSFAKAKKDRMSRRIDAEIEMMDEAEDPEPVIDGQIDLGELAVQYLSLAIDPYPRSEEHQGEEELVLQDNPGPAPKRNPFAALKDWKLKQKDGEK